MWTRSELKTRAKAALKQSYWGLVLVTLIISLLSGGGGGFSGFSNGFNTGKNAGSGDLSGAANSGKLFQGLTDGSIDPAAVSIIAATIIGIILVAGIMGLLVGLFILNPLLVGCQRYVIETCYGPKTVGELGVLGWAFKKGKYGNVVKTLFLEGLYEFLWSLLFIIPGIIKAYEYRMIVYILAENPEVSTKEAFALSKEMMMGNKWNAFVLDLSFIGWHLLGILTCGILEIFYVAPYELNTGAQLYEVLKRNVSANYYDPALGGAAEQTYAAPTYEVYEDNNDQQ
ncbi:MAG: DUF975 family protein [Lachnospiraceae bacterium]|nr:DUF975 family protein [Lachnospiraceae bacterium]